MRKKILLWFAKCIVSMAVAAVILSFFAFFYYNPPIHVSGSSRATGYVREGNARWSRMVEGFAHGRIDENGYNNSYPHDGSEIDILMLGSSQTEGLYVDEDKCLSYLLNKYMDEGGQDLYAYNVAMSAHTLYDNVNNLEAAIDQYKPGKAVCLETTFLACLIEMAEPAVDHSLEAPALNEHSGIVRLLEKNPFVKLTYLQFQNSRTDQEQEASEDEVTEEDIKEALGVDRLIDAMYSQDQMDATYMMLKQISSVCAEKGVKPVIYYIPTFYMDGNRLASERDNDTAELFGLWCDQLGIVFVDPTDSMMDEYENNRILVSGFDNTTINYGHLNEMGHEIIARELYKAVKNMD